MNAYNSSADNYQSTGLAASLRVAAITLGVFVVAVAFGTTSFAQEDTTPDPYQILTNETATELNAALREYGLIKRTLTDLTATLPDSYTKTEIETKLADMYPRFLTESEINHIYTVLSDSTVDRTTVWNESVINRLNTADQATTEIISLLEQALANNQL